MSGKDDINLGNIDHALSRGGPQAEKMRQTIETIADHEKDATLVNPPNTSKTSRVFESREAELQAFSAINSAVVAMIENNGIISENNAVGNQRIDERFKSAYQAIDYTPGISYYRRNLKQLFVEQVTSLSNDKAIASKRLTDTEKEYLKADADSIFSKYNNPDVVLDADEDYDI